MGSNQNRIRINESTRPTIFKKGSLVKKVIIPLLLAFSNLPLVANAATLDLTTFAPSTGVNSQAIVTPTLATLFGTASISGQVAGLASFDWKFNAGDVFVAELNDYSYFTISTGTVPLSNIQTVGSFGDSGWMHYVFSAPYSGNIVLGVQNVGDDENGSELQLRNMTTMTAVPEPDSFAMLMAGLGMMAAIVRRGSRRRATI